MQILERPIFTVAAVTRLRETFGATTAECFDEVFTCRDDGFEKLPAWQPYSDMCAVAALELKEDAKFAWWLSSLLKVPLDTPVEVLEDLLMERGHAMTLAQARVMAENTDRMGNTGMRSNGWGNFFLTENKNGGISFARIGRNERGWHVLMFDVANDVCWGSGNRLLVRNLNII